jgi:glycosyltransferase involved in cell wall biosynthesis
MPHPRRILTFNWHEAYLDLLASAGYSWDVVLRTKGGRSDWWIETRPVPPNMRIVPWPDAERALEAGDYDVAVCHNLHDLALVAGSGIQTITVFHTSFHYEAAFGLTREAVEREAGALLTTTTCVFISAMKRESWGLPGMVIPPGIDVLRFGPYSGEVACILAVGHLKRELAQVNGFEALERIAAGLPLALRGLNPSVAGSRLSASFDEMRATYRTHRLLLHTTLAPYEDGYNLTMLEAMASGMPVVALANPTGPLVNGVNGFVSGDPEDLRCRILELLEDREGAAALGRAGRETVARSFPLSSFQAKWRMVLEAVASRRAPAAPDLEAVRV